MNKIRFFFVYSVFLSINGFSAQVNNTPRTQAHDAKILKVLRDLKREYHRSQSFLGFELHTEVQFLNGEHEPEAQTFFNYKWPENEKKLQAFVKIIGSEGRGFGSREGFIAVSVGTLDTHVYYVENDQINSLALPFGTMSDTRDPKTLTAIRAMLKLIKEKNRPSVFFNSLSYAKIRGYEPTGTSFIELHEDIELDTSGERGYVGRLGNLLSRMIREQQIKGAFIHQSPKELKFAYNWSTAIVKTLPRLGEGNNIIGDFSNNSFSAKRAIGLEVEDRNLIKEDKYKDSADILNRFISNPEQGLPKIKVYLDRMIADVISDITQNPSQFRGQKQIHFVIGFTGHLSRLFWDCKLESPDGEEKAAPVIRAPAALIATPVLAVAEDLIPRALALRSPVPVDMITAKFREWLDQVVQTNTFGIQQAFEQRKNLDFIIHYDAGSGVQTFELQPAKPTRALESQQVPRRANNNGRQTMQVFR